MKYSVSTLFGVWESVSLPRVSMRPACACRYEGVHGTMQVCMEFKGECPLSFLPHSTFPFETGFFTEPRDTLIGC